MKQSTNTRVFTALCEQEFKTNYPQLDVTTLKATNPVSLSKVDLSQKNMAQTGINAVTLSVICGTVFGDSNLAIQSGYKNARLQYRHSTRQTEWFMWKTLCAMTEFLTDNSIQFQAPDGLQRKTEPIGGETLGKWKVATLVSEKLTKVHSEICPNNKKTISRHWLNHMNDYFLMTLWLDDGSLSKGRQGVISCNSTPLKQAEILAEYITTVWKAKCRAELVPSKVTSCGKSELVPSSRFSQLRSNPEPSQIVFVDLDNLQNFLRIVAPIVPVKSMLYKICLFPEDSGIRQRWTSELKTLVRPDFHFEIDKYYAYLEALREQEEKQAKKQQAKNHNSEEDIVQ